MKIALYTAMRNCRRLDYPYEEMLRHHLPLVDEIVVNDGWSNDGSYEVIARLDPRIRVFRTKWNRPRGENWWIHFKDEARRAVDADWCIHLDADEFIPEWEFESLRAYLATTSDLMIPVQFVNFYGNYRVFHRNPGAVHWITKKMIIHRNLPEIEFWGDGSNVKLQGREFTWETSQRQFSVHHFGFVRAPGVLRRAHWTAGRFRTGRSIWWCPPQWVFDLFPYQWIDDDFIDELAIYDGPVMDAVQRNPQRFIRDNMGMLREMESRGATHCCEPLATDRKKGMPQSSDGRVFAAS
jgi:hypothetical protein